MPVVVVDEAELVVHVFAREAEFVLLRHVAFRRDQTSVRPVFIQGAASARFPEEGSDVLHRVVHAVEMLLHLRPVRLPARHGQDARGLRFRGVPEVAAHKYRRFPGQVALRHLQVVTVEVARVEARCPSDRHFFLESPAHVVVGAFHYGFGAFIDEAHRAVFRVVGDLPDAGGCPDQCLIAVRVVNRLKGGFFSALDGGVLVERAGCVGGRFFRVFPRGFPVADVVVTVAVCPAADGGGSQFAPAVAGKAVVDGIPLAGRVPRDGPCQTVVSVFPSHNQIPEKAYKYFLYSVFILNFIIIFTLNF